MKARDEKYHVRSVNQTKRTETKPKACTELRRLAEAARPGREALHHASTDGRSATPHEPPGPGGPQKLLRSPAHSSRS